MLVGDSTGEEVDLPPFFGILLPPPLNGREQPPETLNL